jgi:hypothetical protein
MYMGGRSAVHGLDRGHDLGLVLDLVQQRAEARVGVHAQRIQLVAVLLENRRQPGLHRMAEDDRVGDLHHRGLHVQRKQDALGLRLLDLLGKERLKRCRLMKVASTTVPAG